MFRQSSGGYRAIAGTFALALAAALPLALSAQVRADVITEWNEVFMESIRQTGGPPCPVSHKGAILFLSIYDAVNSIDPTYEPYLSMIASPPGASKEAAVAAAAHRVLSMMFEDHPNMLDSFNDLRQEQLAAIPNGPAKSNGISLGTACANALLAARANDGSQNVINYKGSKKPGQWRPTPPDKTAAFTPHWGNVQPFAIDSDSQFRPAGPGNFTKINKLLKSAIYAEHFNEVKSLGSINSQTRTAEQTEIAIFWANDDDGSYKPPGHLNALTQIVAEQEGNTLEENARLFALVNLAMADAGVAAWDAKFDTKIDLWRPISAIREAHKDANPHTARKKNWTPLSHSAAINGFTPPFPAYVSGHATFAGAWSTAMAAFYGTDNVPFTATSDYMPGIERSFAGFSDAGWENAESRIYLGVHYRFDAEDGFALGVNVANYVVQNFLRPLN